MLLRDPSLNAEARQDIETMLAAGQQGSELARQMADFSRRGEMDLVPCDLSEVVDRHMRFFERTLPTGVWLARRLSDMPLPVKVDAAQFQRVLTNLYLNACKAMKGSGRLMVSTSADEVGGRKLATVTVSDTGPGIDPRMQEKVFEPFVTTRHGEGGVGLGLYIARNIVTAHGGTISVESLSDHGARCTIRLPMPADQ